MMKALLCKLWFDKMLTKHGHAMIVFQHLVSLCMDLQETSFSPCTRKNEENATVMNFAEFKITTANKVQKPSKFISTLQQHNQPLLFLFQLLVYWSIWCHLSWCKNVRKVNAPIQICVWMNTTRKPNCSREITGICNQYLVTFLQKQNMFIWLEITFQFWLKMHSAILPNVGP